MVTFRFDESADGVDRRWSEGTRTMPSLITIATMPWTSIFFKTTIQMTGQLVDTVLAVRKQGHNLGRRACRI
jgi:hypothetical protein